MTSEKLQALAEELAAIRGDDSERAQIKNLEARIADYEFGILNEYNPKKDKAYFPLLKRHNGVIPFEAFYDIFTDVLLPLLKNYDATKATFTTAFSYLLNLRVNDYWREKYKEFPVAEPFFGNDEPVSLIDSVLALGADHSEHPYNEFELFLLAAPIVAERKKQEQHLSKSKKSYFEGFFTFDTTKQTKDGLFDEHEVIAENDTLFPIMEFVILEYLLEGHFDSMHDVVKNAVKDTKRLEQRNETMQRCYDLSKPTVVSRNKLYDEMMVSVGAIPQQKDRKQKQ
jgi:hypothetical protein